MSVQAGIWNFDETPIQLPLLESFSRLTAEYGPDGEANHLETFIGMMFRSFHTTPESRLEAQPYVSPAGRVFTWDGRLDNRDEISRFLEVSTLAAHRSDVAIVAAAFDHIGSSCFPLLRGDWALAIWDPQEQELVLARDYIGVKPLYYYQHTKGLMWCSHLAPLALCGDQFKLCDEYIAGYLAFHPDAHLTPYREILSVSPGSFVRIRNRQTTKCCYWTPTASPAGRRHRSDRDYEEHFLHLLQQGVRRRLRTDSPALAELSGGLDSSSIVCVADQLIAQGEAPIPRLDTFSYYDSNEPGEDDRFHFSKVAEQRRHTGFSVDLRGCGDSLPLEVSTFTATPGFGCRVEIKAAMSAIAQTNCYRIILCGMGGDEVNGQTLDPRVQLADLLAEFRGGEFIELLLAWSLRMRQPWIQVLLQTLVRFLPPSLEARLVSRGRLEPWIQGTFARRYRMSARRLEVAGDERLAHPRDRDTQHTIATLARQLTRTGPSLLEQRYPFLDQDLVEFLAQVPVEQLLRPGQRRFLMKRALADVLPTEILTRTTKTSAGRCYALTLSKHWNRIEKLLEHPLVTHLGYVKRDPMYHALQKMKAGEIPPSFLRLLKALALELWLHDVARRGVLALDLPCLPGACATDKCPADASENFGRCC
ncbi:MAG TPA: asparagine synthase-related protein [Terriglobales bacterium]|jgi:asparagine synthase (glutamine-hydrolysing)|nr:asparagine synthase-related protein [Terriglobales bacterium]